MKKFYAESTFIKSAITYWIQIKMLGNSID